MKTALFVDTDVIIDFLIDRKPFSDSSAEIFALAEKEKINLYVSSLSFANVFYVVRKVVGFDKAIEVLLRLESITEILPVGKITINQALMARFSDFEEAIQNFTASQEGNIKTLITRNVRDYKKSLLNIQTPEEFIKSFPNQ